MSAFDRLQGYSAKRGLNETSDVFDVTTPAGAFLNRVHNEGYKMYEYRYHLKPEFRVPDGDYANLMSEEEQKQYEASLDISESAYEKIKNKEQYERVTVFTETHDAITTSGNQIINAVAGSGKALKNGTGVLTPNGFVPIETLKVGDLVASDDGKFYPVRGVFPQGLKDAYELKFSDGNTIICSGDHLWNVQTDSQRTMEYRGSKGYFWDTKSVMDIISTIPLKTRSGKNNCYIPMQEAIDFSKDVTLPLHPYILGVLLGNGTLSLKDSIMFSTADSSVLDMLGDLLNIELPTIDVVYSSGYDYRLARNDSAEGTHNELKDRLRELNLLGTHSDTKFIPENYLYSSIDSRLDLLAGLLDTDGYWANSYYEYTTVSKRLADNVVFLCESLGLTVHVSEKKSSYIDKVTNTRVKCKLSYRLSIKPSIKYSKLHNCDRINAQFRQTQGYCRRQIRSITDLHCQYEMTCISVGSPNHLFLTEHFIPTHNTTALTFKILYDIVTGEAMTLKQIESGLPVRVVNKMWVCTFLKSGADELQNSLIKWQRKLGYSQTADQINFSTMDAEFKRCLNAMGVATNIGDSAKLHSLFCKAVDSCNIARTGGYALTKEDYQILSGILVYYRGRLDEKRYAHPSMSDYELTPTILDLLAKQFANLRASNGIMDFEEIMELLYKYLYITPNPAVQDFVANRYNYIYIDEFQDTSQMAYAILKFYGRGKLWINRDGSSADTSDGLHTGVETLGKMVVVGDPSQCVTKYTDITMANGDTHSASGLDVGDEILTPWGSDKITNIEATYTEGMFINIELTDGKTLSVTPEHKLFVVNDNDIHAEVDYEEYDDFDWELSLIRCGLYFYVLAVEARNKNEEFGYIMCEKFTSYEKAYAFCDTFKYNTKCLFFEYLVPESSKISFTDLYDSYVLLTNEDITDDDEDWDEAFGIVENMIDVARYCKVMSAFSIKEGMSLLTDEGFVAVKSIEYEDASHIVYDLSTEKYKAYISNGIVSHNCIYSFRGSDSKILVNDFDEDFKPCLSRLSVNWRCPANILNPVVSSIHVNEDSSRQTIKAARDGGEFYAYAFPSYKSMIGQLKTDMTKDMEDNMKVAVLCRTNFDGLIPAFVLAEDGRFDFSISGENMTLNSPLPRKIIGVTSLFTERSTPAVKTTLEFFASRQDKWAVKQLIDTLKMNNMSIWQIPIEDIKYSCPSLVDFVTNVKKVFFDNGKRNKEKEIEALRTVYYMMIVDVFSGDSAYCESARAYIETLLYVIENHDFQSVYEFLEEIELLNDKLAGRIKKKSAYIQIATVHEYKGKECDSVYVWNDSDGTFPSSKCDVNNEEQLAEERRVHYIACTRAKKREHIYSIQIKKGRFAKEMDCDWVNPVNPSAKLSKTSSDLIL